MTGPTWRRLAVAWLVAMVVAQALFAMFPGIDLAVSRHFARPTGGFPWADGPVWYLNLAVRRAGEVATFAAGAVCLVGGVTGRLRRDGLLAWGYPVLCVAASSGVVVNLLLKSHIGRARPDSVAEFGGTARFTPPWQVVQECARNCSFTSGEVAMAAALAIAAVVLLWPRLGTAAARLWAVLAAGGYVAAVAALRIGLGRHFLSDTVFAALFAAGVALALYPAMRIGTARAAFDPALPLALGSPAVASLRGQMARLRSRAP